MNRHFRLGLLCAAVALVSAVGGYVVGFRSAWELGLYADAAPRGSLALSSLRALQAGRLDQLRPVLEGDIDSGLIWWSRLESSVNYPVINLLSGTDVVPDYERYVRRLAAHRAVTASPNFAAWSQAQARSDSLSPEIQAELALGEKEARAAIDAMVTKYGR